MLCISSFFHAILHHSTVIQGNSFGVQFNGLLAELPAILDSFFNQYHYIGVAGGEPQSGGEKHVKY